MERKIAIIVISGFSALILIAGALAYFNFWNNEPSGIPGSDPVPGIDLCDDNIVVERDGSRVFVPYNEVCDGIIVEFSYDSCETISDFCVLEEGGCEFESTEEDSVICTDFNSNGIYDENEIFRA